MGINSRSTLIPRSIAGMIRSFEGFFRKISLGASMTNFLFHKSSTDDKLRQENQINERRYRCT